MSAPTLSTGIPARLAAAELLDAVLTRRLALEQEVARHAGFNALPGPDRAFVHLMLKTALRRLGQVDALLAHCMERQLPQHLSLVRQVMRLGVVQLIWLEVPAHAAVNVSVEAVKALGFASHTGLVNAVLKRVATEGAALAGAQGSELNTPDWLHARWVAAYGESQARAIEAAHTQEPVLDISVKEKPAHWAQTLGGSVLAGNTVRLQTGGNITGLPGFEEGAWWVQDAAAALPARLLLAALGEAQEKRIIDFCAAPGGKTAQLAASGARVTALDISAARMRTLTQNMQRLKLTVDTAVANGNAWQPEAPPHGILLDAPCSATGTVRRHPDVAWHRTQEDLTRLQAAQERLLAHACTLLAPAGVLVYAVCSLEPEEGPQQVAQLLAAQPHMRLLPVTPQEAGIFTESLTPAGEIRTLPSHLAAQGGVDGFYAARLIRTEE